MPAQRAVLRILRQAGLERIVFGQHLLHFLFHICELISDLLAITVPIIITVVLLTRTHDEQTSETPYDL